MGIMNILFCAYRDWAINSFKYCELNKPVDTNWSLIEKSEHLFNEDISHYDIIFFIGCIMLHPSPLPKYRGGSPIQHQIINGEDLSAVTLFIMNKKLDTGDIISQRPYCLSGDLSDILDRISNIGSNMIVNLVDCYKQTRHLKTVKQIESHATFYRRRTPEQSEITIDELFNSTAEQVHNKVRSLQDPYPNAFIRLFNGQKLYLCKTKLKLK